MNFSILLRTHLKNKNMKLIDLAKLLGISRQSLNNSLNRWESRDPTIKTIKKISIVLNISPSYFFDEL
ncbi:MAG: helix-turn-helix transcriptional regulator [Cetobacterium sp.]|uniref:helix-turn-helix domain-containing protein n=1 Tax=Cetobacterium sp. TaxID=2071632 RepID=UPI002FC90C01